MKPGLLHGISETNEEHLKTSTHLRAKEKSDQQILEIYKNIVGDVDQNDSILNVWQKKQQKQKENERRTEPELDKIEKIKAKPNLSLRKQQTSSPVKRTDKSFELSSINPPIRLPPKNTTNYSEGYREAKPFSLKKQGGTVTVYVHQPVSIPPSPEVKQSSVAEQFVKRLSHNITRQRGEKNEIASKISKTVMQMKQQQKRLKDQIRQINKQQQELQDAIRKYHSEYKDYCYDVQQKHNVDRSCQQIKSTKEILTLEPYSKENKPHSKKTQLIQQYKPYSDKIEHQIRKIDYMVQVKKENIEREEINIENSRLYGLLQQPLEQMNYIPAISDRPIIEGPTYKQIMRARKNKNFNKLQQLIGQPKQQEPNPTIQPNMPTTKREETRVYQNQHGQMKVNQNLRDLLLN